MTEGPNCTLQIIDYDEDAMEDLGLKIESLLRKQWVYYSRGKLWKDPRYRFRRTEETVTVRAPTLQKLAEDGKNDLMWGTTDTVLSGTCRDIAPAIGEYLKETGEITDHETWACYQDENPEDGLSKNEYHYVTIGAVQGARVLIDMGYNQPIPISIVIDGGPVISDFYGENQPKGFYGGKVRYEAKTDATGAIILTIGTESEPAKYKTFKFFRADHRPNGEGTPTVDEKIVGEFGRLTDKNYRTRVVLNDDDSYQMVKEFLDGPNLLGELYGTIKELGDRARIIVKIK